MTESQAYQLRALTAAELEELRLAVGDRRYTLGQLLSEAQPGARLLIEQRDNLCAAVLQAVSEAQRAARTEVACYTVYVTVDLTVNLDTKAESPDPTNEVLRRLSAGLSDMFRAKGLHGDIRIDGWDRTNSSINPRYDLPEE